VNLVKKGSHESEEEDGSLGYFEYMAWQDRPGGLVLIGVLLLT
jgi:hypothetical protein